MKNKLLVITIIAIIGFSIMTCENDNQSCEHIWDWVETSAPTTTEAGVETKTCTKCGEKDGTRKGNPATGNNNGHTCTFGEWTQTTSPTCTLAGIKTRNCTECDTPDIETKVGDSALGHKWVKLEGIHMECVICKIESQINFVIERTSNRGHTIRFYAEEGIDHTEIIAFINGLTNPLLNSRAEGISHAIQMHKIESGLIIEIGEDGRGILYRDGTIGTWREDIDKALDFVSCHHGSCSFTEWTQTTTPTCSLEGIRTRSCVVCGTLGTITESIAPLGHSWVDVGKENRECEHCGIIES